MDRHTLRKALPYLLPSAAGTAVFYAAPFLVMLVYALSAGSVPEVLSGHALAAGARSTAVFLSCGIGASVLLGLCIALIDLFFAWRTFREVYLLTGDYPHEGLYLLQHYLLHAFRRLQYGKLAAVSLAVTLALAAVTGLFFRLSSVRGKDVDA